MPSRATLCPTPYHTSHCPLCPTHALSLQEHGLDFQRLLDASAYKERYRQDMIRWGEEKRRADPGFFCRSAVRGAAQPVWVSRDGDGGLWGGSVGPGVGGDGACVQVVSDTRRLSDVEWFRDAYGDAVLTVRVTATEETRRRRSWVFVAGERALLPPAQQHRSNRQCWHRGHPCPYSHPTSPLQSSVPIAIPIPTAVPCPNAIPCPYSRPPSPLQSLVPIAIPYPHCHPLSL